MREKDYGISFESPITKEAMTLSAFGFVDDMDYVQTARHDDNEDDVFKKTQMGMKLWEELLSVTGGQ